MDTALLGVLLGFALAIIYKAVDLLTLRREEQRQAEEHARSRAELDARWQEIEERHRRIAILLENLPTARRKRELVDIAARADREKRYDEAITAVEELLALESDPERRAELVNHLGALFNNRGVAKGNLGQYREAIADYDQAIALDPRNAAAYNNRGTAKGHLGQYAEAIADCNQALTLFEAAGDREKAEIVRRNRELVEQKERGGPIAEAAKPILIPSRPEPVLAARR